MESLKYSSRTTQLHINTMRRNSPKTISYKNNSKSPPESVDIKWTYSDGNFQELQGPGDAITVSTVTPIKITRVNDPPTGSVFIFGDPIQGQKLVALSSINDPEGVG